jgi:hypothetical protein
MVSDTREKRMNQLRIQATIVLVAAALCVMHLRGDGVASTPAVGGNRAPAVQRDERWVLHLERFRRVKRLRG